MTFKTTILLSPVQSCTSSQAHQHRACWLCAVLYPSLALLWHVRRSRTATGRQRFIPWLKSSNTAFLTIDNSIILCIGIICEYVYMCSCYVCMYIYVCVLALFNATCVNNNNRTLYCTIMAYIYNIIILYSILHFTFVYGILILYTFFSK